MKSKILINGLIVAGALMFSGCGENLYLKYQNDVPTSQKEYFKKYENTQKDEAFHGLYAIKYSELNLKFFNDTIPKLETINVLESMELLTKRYSIPKLNHLSTVWRTSISSNVRDSHNRLNANEAIDIYLNESSRLGEYDKLNEYTKILQFKIKNLDSSKYQKTYELYSVTMQLVSLCKTPSGSLITFNTQINDLRMNFEKLKVLSDIELNHK